MKNEFQNLLRLARLARQVLDDEHYTLCRVTEICGMSVEQARTMLRTLQEFESEEEQR